MFTHQEMDVWLQKSIRLFPSVEQWLKIWEDAKGTKLRHLKDDEYQALLQYLENYYVQNHEMVSGC